MEQAAVTAVAVRPASHPAAGWREAERQVFRELDRLLGGDTLPAPTVAVATTLWDRSGAGQTMASDDARRAGYFAEFAALLLGAPRRAELLAWSEALHVRLRSALGPAPGWPPLAAVPGGHARAVTGLDELAARWRISPPLDRARFLAERPTLGLP